ncbi:MAG: radical SAM protein [Chloroflexi bacterium]|nr:radical SAM protein [Chloroflexota bacterium]MCC6891804.1 radical SAM protein [Anaerolineae bacterium]
MKPKHLLNLVSDQLYTLPLVVLYLTDGCNSRCVTCDIWRNPRRNMKMELVDEIASAFEELQTRWVLLSGGEAMQHPQWPQIARRFRDEGTFVMLLTNGLLLRKQADDLVGNVDEVIVSLDGGTANTYDAIRGVDAFDLILDGIRAARARGIPVAIRTTIQRSNFREMPQIIEAAKQAGANRVSFLTVDVSNQYAFGPRFVADPALQLAGGGGAAIPVMQAPAPTALDLNDVAAFEQVVEQVITDFADDFDSGLIAESPAKFRSMVRYFAALNGEADFPRPRCNSPHISTVIEVDGTLRPCYFLPSYGRLSVGENLSKAINTPVAQALRQAYKSGQRAECERCVCPLYKGPRALLRM